jgi:O-antigen ligase
VALGLVALVMAATQRRRSPAYVIAAAPLLLGVAVAGQRAAIVALATSAAILLLAAVLPPAGRRFWVTPTQVGIVVAVGVALITLVVIVPVATSSSASPQLPLLSDLNNKLNSTGKQQSASQRVNQIDAATPAIEQRVITGWGLGKTIRYFETGQNQTTDSPITHNIALDLLLRMGVVGFLLFAITIMLMVRDGIQTWRLHPDNAVAALALVCMAVVVGLLAKGLVESIFEKYRIAVFLGIFMGIVRSAATSPRPASSFAGGWQRRGRGRAREGASVVAGSPEPSIQNVAR